jgi:CRP-like cAMP-binding protein
VSPGEVLRIRRDQFEEVLRDFPELWSTLRELSEKRLEAQRRVAGPVATRDSSVMI